MPLHNHERLQSALGRIDAANAEDPNLELQDGQRQPRELVYSRWLTAWVLRLKPDASELLRLAARAQHICRWHSPRESYPQTREGYLQWRGELKKFHASKAGEILREAGYTEEEVTRVRELILKKLFPKDDDARVLEDALCLVFLEKQFGPLAEKTSDEKMVNALRKAWKKMSPMAREIALTIPYSPKERALIDAALASGQV